MKKLLGIAALCLAFTPLVQAQTNSALSAHPDARNDRSTQEYIEHRPAIVRHPVVKHRHHKHHRHHMKRHHKVKPVR